MRNLKKYLFILVFVLPIQVFANDTAGVNLHNKSTNGNYFEKVAIGGYPKDNVIKLHPASVIQPGQGTTMQVWLNKEMGERNNAWVSYNVYNPQRVFQYNFTMNVYSHTSTVKIGTKTYDCNQGGQCYVGE